MQDPRLSNITLGWMVSELEAKKLLTFNKDYLLNTESISTASQSSTPWASRGGQNDEEFVSKSKGLMRLFSWLGDAITNKVLWKLIEGLKWVVVHILYLIPDDSGRRMSGVRIPREYVPIKNFKRDPKHKGDFETWEHLHDSINDRLLGLESDPPIEHPNTDPHTRLWPCKALKGTKKIDDNWAKPIDYGNYWHNLACWMRRWFGKGKKEFEEVVNIEVLKDEAHEIEQLFKNRMRFNQRCKEPWLGELHIHCIRLSRLQLIVNRSQDSCREDGCGADCRAATAVLVRRLRRRLISGIKFGA